PFIQIGTPNYKPALLEGIPFYCDDAGSLACTIETPNLEEQAASITTSVSRVFDVEDAMLTVPWSIVDRATFGDRYLMFLMTSSGQFQNGEYMVALHLGVADAEAQSQSPVA